MSEIARLREQIELECEAMRLALHGYAAVASHKQGHRAKVQRPGATPRGIRTARGKRGGEQHHCRDLFEGGWVGYHIVLVSGLLL
jgi:hypothetical protein